MAENHRHRAENVDWEMDGTAFALHGVVVEQETGPTRCTVYPRRRAHDERTTTWLSADHAAFYDLEAMR